jgi:hypothetical protein
MYKVSFIFDKYYKYWGEKNEHLRLNPTSCKRFGFLKTSVSLIVRLLISKHRFACALADVCPCLHYWECQASNITSRGQHFALSSEHFNCQLALFGCQLEHFSANWNTSVPTGTLQCQLALFSANWHSSATLTKVFPCFFLNCKANAKV